MTSEAEITCPFCGENFSIVVDCSVDHQTYIEDCYVCCRPIQISVSCEAGDVIGVDVGRS